MNSKNQVQVLMSFIKKLQKHGCIVSHTGRVTLPFKCTTASLAQSVEVSREQNLQKLGRWIRKSGLEVTSGTLGKSKTVILRSDDVKICRLVAVKGGGYQLKATSNWVKPQPKPKKGVERFEIKLLSRKQMMKKAKKAQARSRTLH